MTALFICKIFLDFKAATSNSERMKANSPWCESLSLALTAAFAEIEGRQVVIAPDMRQEAENVFIFGGMSYNETKSANIPIVTLQGKPTKKYAHITIYRAESGRYEVTTYLL